VILIYVYFGEIKISCLIRTHSYRVILSSELSHKYLIFYIIKIQSQRVLIGKMLIDLRDNEVDEMKMNQVIIIHL